jgi:hypothetical protein
MDDAEMLVQIDRPACRFAEARFANKIDRPSTQARNSRHIRPDLRAAGINQLGTGAAQNEASVRVTTAEWRGLPCHSATRASIGPQAGEVAADQGDG